MICAVVLAAGESHRMGTAKQLLPFGNTTVIEHIVDQLLLSHLDEICVVVGHDGERVAERLRSRRVRIVANPDYASGMLSSVRCGLRALPEACDAIVVALGDQPAVAPEWSDAMVQALRSAGRGIVVPVHQGRRGHPLVFSARYREEILTHHDEVGLRGLLPAHPEDVHELAMPTAAVLSDMDHPEDYRREVGRQGKDTLS